MPIIYSQNKDPIAYNQIREVLNHERDINARVFNMGKQSVRYYNEPMIETNNTSSPDLLNQFDNIVNTFITEADKGIEQFGKMQNTASIREIYKDVETFSVQSIIYLYNAIVQRIQQAQSQRQNTLYKNSTMRMIPILKESISTLKPRIMNSLSNSFNSNDVNKTIKMISVYSIYKFILDSVDGNTYKVLDINQIDSLYRNVVNNEFSNIKKFGDEQYPRSESMEVKAKLAMIQAETPTELTESQKKRIINSFNVGDLTNPIFDKETTQILQAYSDKALRADLNNTVYNNIGDNTGATPQPPQPPPQQPPQQPQPPQPPQQPPQSPQSPHSSNNSDGFGEFSGEDEEEEQPQKKTMTNDELREFYHELAQDIDSGNNDEDIMNTFFEVDRSMRKRGLLMDEDEEEGDELPVTQDISEDMARTIKTRDNINRALEDKPTDPELLLDKSKNDALLKKQSEDMARATAPQVEGSMLPTKREIAAMKTKKTKLENELGKPDPTTNKKIISIENKIRDQDFIIHLNQNKTDKQSRSLYTQAEKDKQQLLRDKIQAEQDLREDNKTRRTTLQQQIRRLTEEIENMTKRTAPVVPEQAIYTSTHDKQHADATHYKDLDLYAHGVNF